MHDSALAIICSELESNDVAYESYVQDRDDESTLEARREESAGR